MVGFSQGERPLGGACGLKSLTWPDGGTTPFRGEKPTAAFNLDAVMTTLSPTKD
jgi:hypothetical protein